jgi:Adaptor complexes medium subunit family
MWTARATQTSALRAQVLFESQGRTKGKAVDLEDMKFHQCVRLARFENDRTISFIPPDGAFDLMCVRTRGVLGAAIAAGVGTVFHALMRRLAPLGD